ncbi:hypothetical protein ACFFFR_04660 [Micrococcoides hystricis]|uniref:Uncharacterized protein n=1 Tax=Micrococcoides hystricis TaxID=1572761 RepID=A0ABV6P9C2_9MICC
MFRTVSVVRQPGESSMPVGLITSIAWIVMILAYIGHFILRLDLRWLEDEYQPIWYFLGMAIFPPDPEHVSEHCD